MINKIINFFKKENNTLKIKKFNPKATIPSKRRGDGGYDLYAIYESSIIIIPPGSGYVFNTGIGFEIPEGYSFLICNRGSVGKEGLVYGGHLNDSNYRGAIMLDMHNISNKTIIITNLNKEEFYKIPILNYYLNSEYEITIISQSKALSQAIIIPTYHWEVEEVEELSNSERGSGLLGSTDK